MTSGTTQDRSMMSYGRRRRLEAIENAEAEGMSFWTDELDTRTRARLYHEVKMLIDSVDWLDLASIIRYRTLSQEGLVKLSDHVFAHNDQMDILYGILDQDDSIVLALIESTVSLPEYFDSDPFLSVEFDLHDSREIRNVTPFLSRFAERVRTIFREHRVNCDLVENRFVPFNSRVSHENVVVPALSLLGSRKDFERVEVTYQKALEEIHGGSPEDAITDAATALQEALVALGCEGNRLGPLAKSARKRAVITAYDKKLIEWVSADRSNMGDAHNASPASTEDAWLVVHVVGALILRIAGGPMRGVEQPQ